MERGRKEGRKCWREGERKEGERERGREGGREKGEERERKGRRNTYITKSFNHCNDIWNQTCFPSKNATILISTPQSRNYSFIFQQLNY